MAFPLTIDDVAQSHLFDLLIAPIKWQLLRAGLEMNIFDLLFAPLSVKELAKEQGFKENETQILLDALVSMGLLTKRLNHYQVAAKYRLFLITDDPQSMRETLLHLETVRHGNVDTICSRLKNGVVKKNAVDFSQPEFWQKAVNNLRAFHTSCSNDVALGILQGLPEWPQVRCFLDLGAGSECLAVSLAEQHPELKVRVFDLPLCAKSIEAALLPIHKEHIQVIAGDYNEANIVGDNDVIWTSMSLYYAKDLNMLLSNLKAALSKKGMLVSLHEGLTDARTSPEYHVVGRFFPALNGNNVSFGRGDIADTMRSVGFNKVISRTIHTLYGPMDLDIAYC